MWRVYIMPVIVLNFLVKKKDAETQQMIEDLEIRIRDLERHNQLLVNKVFIYRYKYALHVGGFHFNLHCH